jgi:DNA topoisomerase-1
MQIAQQLYEGVKLPGGKTTGLITYMRTDSTAVSPAAAEEAREVIGRYFPAALPDQPPVYRTRVKNAQEAHEAIRPTSPARTPKSIRDALTPDQDRLYTLIWRRFIASQMKPAVYRATTVIIATARAGVDLPYLFRARGREMLEPGFTVVYELRESTKEGEPADQNLPPLTGGEPLICHSLLPEQHFTRPPAHFTEASLMGSAGPAPSPISWIRCTGGGTWSSEKHPSTRPRWVLWWVISWWSVFPPCWTSPLPLGWRINWTRFRTAGWIGGL